MHVVVRYIRYFIMNLGNNDIFVTLAALASIVSLFLTGYIMTKSSSISRTLKKMGTATTFNKERMQYAERFQGYIDGILIDGNASQAIVHSISQEVQIVERKFEILHTRYDFWIIFKTKRNLKAKVVDFNKLCHQLDYIIVKLKIEED